MARKITPRERCTFCGKQPCECAIENRNKRLQQTDADIDEEQIENIRALADGYPDGTG